MDQNKELLEQLTWHWEAQLRPRLEGLTDEEYFWEPVSGSWNLRPRSQAKTKMAAGVGDYVIDFEYPEPEPAPVTTIAWQFAHLLVGIFGARIASHFGGEPMDYQTYEYPTTAKDALAQLDHFYALWTAGVKGLGEDGLTEASGEEGHETASMATLVLHINREIIHHGSEIALLRDLFAWREAK